MVVGGDRHRGRAFHSRYAVRRTLYPHPGADLEGFVSTLCAELERDHIDVVLPTSDYTAIAISKAQERVSVHSRPVVPPHDALSLSMDKLRTLRAAEELGIDTPKTHVLESPEDLESILEVVEFPCVVKPRRGMGAIGVHFVHTPEELRRVFAARSSWSDSVFAMDRSLVQELIPGEVHDVCLLFNQGEVRAALTQKRLITFPSRGGAGVYNETTDEPELKEQAIAILRQLNWHGPAQVEFKVDLEHRRITLMEINGRFWGTLDLAVAAGVDFPTLACAIALHGDIEPVFRYRVGLRYRWPIPYVILNARQSKRPCWSVWQFIRPERDTLSDLWLGDPTPWLAEARYAVDRIRTRRRQNRQSTLKSGLDSDLDRLRTIVPPGDRTLTP